MKDFPVFTTQNGAASLILKEIPYRGEAYIRIQSSQCPEILLEECISFCRICGAQKIYAAGDTIPEEYPLHTAVLQMRGTVSIAEEEIPAMFPVTERTVSDWRAELNRKLKNVDNAATITAADEKEILESGGAYYIHESGTPIGLGWLQDTQIRAVASLRPGAGTLVCKGLQSIRPGEQLELEVASTNRKAIALYERLGFLAVQELSRWYRVL